jgi:hypothetical protein
MKGQEISDFGRALFTGAWYKPDTLAAKQEKAFTPTINSKAFFNKRSAVFKNK